MFAALLAVWPWTEHPFSTPKLGVLWASALASLALLPWSRRPRCGSRRAIAWAGFALLATSALSALASDAGAFVPGAQALGAALLLVAWAVSGVNLRAVARAAAAAGAVAATVTLLQAAGVDPFAAFAPLAGGARLRLYGTLGNPDFVASALGVTLCLTLGEFPLSPSGVEGPSAGSAQALDSARAERNWLLFGAAVVQLAALAATRSFATALAIGAALAVAALHRARHHLPLKALGFAAALALLAALPLMGRDLGASALGRLYLLRVAAPYALEAPLFGRGPGAVERLWPIWEVALWRARCGEDPACVQAHPDARFAALQDHLHNDWLERLVETGVPGLVALAAVLALAARAALRHPSPRATGLAAALAVLTTRSTVDFPLARPADLCLAAALVAMAASLDEPKEPP